MRGIVLTFFMFGFVIWDYSQNDARYLREFLYQLGALLY